MYICGIICSSRFVILSVAKNLKGVMNLYYVYMLTNWNNKVLYTGVTNDLERRIYEHKNKLVKVLRKNTM